ncbi:MAG: ParB/RepB/Spo0J family partition protein [Campylobacter sp.]
MAKKGGLGRGLNSILLDVENSFSKELENSVLEIEISQISPNSFQPRKIFDENALKELSESIKTHGLLQPIIVTQKENGYMLIAGERRLRATKLLGQSKIRAIVADFADKNLRELALIENIQREDLNPIELANSYKELINEYKITQEELGNIVKKSRPVITNTMRLLNLSDFTQQALIDGKISVGHAKVMLGFDKKDEKELLNTIIGQKLTANDTEKLVKQMKNRNNAPSKFTNDTEFQVEILKLKKILQDYANVTTKNKKVTLNFTEISKIRDLIDKII